MKVRRRARHVSGHALRFSFDMARIFGKLRFRYAKSIQHVGLALSLVVAGEGMHYGAPIKKRFAWRGDALIW
jgi:hypothetical protein